MNGILEVIKEGATSKKLIAAVAGAITAAALKIGLDLPTADVVAIIAPVVAYIIGQGVADSGKEAAKVQAIAEVSRELPTNAAIEAVKNT